MVTNIICELMMTYTFKYQTKAMDLWQLTMYSVYASFLGPINIIFTVAMLLLNFKYLMSVSLILKVLMVIGALLFLLIQPLLIYYNSWKKVKSLPKEIEIKIDYMGLHICSHQEKADIKWSQVKAISRKPSLLVLITSDQHGYILSNKVLKGQKDDVYSYVQSMIEKANTQS